MGGGNRRNRGKPRRHDKRDHGDDKCNKKCGPCKRCKNGTCKKKRDGTVCQGDGVCTNGQCTKGGSTPPPRTPTCGVDGALCGTDALCCEGFSCNGGTCAANACVHSCQPGENICTNPPVQRCCGGRPECRCLTTNNGPFCFGGGGFGGCTGETAQGKTVPACTTDAECTAVFGVASGARCISAAISSGCCSGGRSACVLPCPS